jgi:GTPase SAR1 family protein
MGQEQPDLEKEQYIFKVGLVGDVDVGKRTYAKVATVNLWDDRYLETLGALVTKFQVTHRGKKALIEIRMMVWDISARVKSPSLRVSYIAGVSGAIIMADASRPETIRNLEGWANLLHSTLGPIPLVFVLNKIEEVNTAMLQTAIREVGEVARQFKVKSYALSAKRSDGKTLLKPLKVLGQEILKNIEDQSP